MKLVLCQLKVSGKQMKILPFCEDMHLLVCYKASAAVKSISEPSDSVD